MPKLLSTLDNSDNISTGSVNWFVTSADLTKLESIQSGAEVNQNAFTSVAVSGQTTVAADGKEDTLTLVAGTNVTITTDAATDSITINATGGGSTYTAGTGLTLTTTVFSLTQLVAGSSSVGAVQYNGVTKLSGAFYGGTTTPDNTTRLNYSGYLYATQLYEGSTRVSVTGHTHTGTAVGRTISTSDPSGGTDGDVWYKV